MSFKYFMGIDNTRFEEWSEQVEKEENEKPSCCLWRCLKAIFCCKCCKKRFKDMSPDDASIAKEKSYSKVLKENEYIFLVKIDPVTQNYLAKKLGIKVYDNKRMYHREIDLEDTDDNESFRDI